MRMFRWSELEQLLSEYGTVVAASADRCRRAAGAGAQGQLLARVELDLAAEPGAISCGEHILAVLKNDR